MTIRFTKMHGLGNDFVVIDARLHPVSLSPATIQRMADRHKGIGFDQLLLIETSSQKECDFGYRIFNADGKEVENCGNGARCVARYLYDSGLIEKSDLRLACLGGVLALHIEGEGMITVDMGNPHFSPEKIPFVVDEERSEYQLVMGDEILRFKVVSIGNPHVVIQVEDVNCAPVEKVGKFIQQQACFPQQANVGFMEVHSPTDISLRVFERGVGETLACGSGACAAVAAGRRLGYLGEEVTVSLPGGKLKVLWRSGADSLYLIGPAEPVFEGHWFE